MPTLQKPIGSGFGAASAAGDVIKDIASHSSSSTWFSHGDCQRDTTPKQRSSLANS
jgi:hypothetical protein